MKVPAPRVSPHRNGYPGRDSESVDGDQPPRSGFDEATNVMESGLLRALTDESAREGGQGDADVGVEAPAAVPQPARRSRVFVIAGTVAAIVLAFDAWLITHHRQPAKPSPAAPLVATHALPTYTLLPLGTPPPSEPAASKMPAAAPSSLAVVEQAAPAIVAPTPHRHRHGHHRH